MKNRKLLIVDDEKNIRMTLRQALADIDVETDTAVNGEEALTKLSQSDYSVALLDLKMPGMDGMAVLRQLSQDRPEIQVVVVTAHGTIDSAAEAIKLGAVDFVQKPFNPNEIRQLVTRLLQRDIREEDTARDYEFRLESAKQCITKQHFKAAMEHLKKAIATAPSRPEAFNLLGALHDISHDKLEAQKNYRAALALDPAYKPALDNLERSTGSHPDAEDLICLDEEDTY